MGRKSSLGWSRESKTSTFQNSSKPSFPWFYPRNDPRHIRMSSVRIAIRLSFCFFGICSMVPGAVTPRAKRITHPKLALLVSPSLWSAALVLFRIACDCRHRGTHRIGIFPIRRLRLPFAAENPAGVPMLGPVLHVNLEPQVPAFRLVAGRKGNSGPTCAIIFVYHGGSRRSAVSYRDSSRQLEAYEISMLFHTTTLLGSRPIGPILLPLHVCDRGQSPEVLETLRVRLQ